LARSARDYPAHDQWHDSLSQPTSAFGPERCETTELTITRSTSQRALERAPQEAIVREIGPLP
jgi:hypothetical protein